ncbi:uncharacterized protein LOC124491418 [Dermatophagoides farinae]|uniref:Uncharacterized protein n=1 Tax=Dermatophagoides farinae TaxID=6954 RepID=A0A922KVS3_DERFA|nr:uncharacterized protein LOC124491418 [Dermatophagoides farinae]KAH7645404.1 hypothetical protein HUG17_0942 [Dermatophagoides farinae]KAH9497761.1 hypothetical protein DERF_013720 [Dermatophagoides farinae]
MFIIYWQIFILLTVTILNIISMAISLLTSLQSSNELFIENRQFYWLHFYCSFIYLTLTIWSLYHLFFENELIALYTDIGTFLSILCIVDFLFLSYLFFIEFSLKIKIVPSNIFIWPGLIIYIISTLRIIFISILIHIFNYDLSQYKWDKGRGSMMMMQ